MRLLSRLVVAGGREISVPVWFAPLAEESGFRNRTSVGGRGIGSFSSPCWQRIPLLIPLLLAEIPILMTSDSRRTNLIPLIRIMCPDESLQQGHRDA